MLFVTILICFFVSAALLIWAAVSFGFLLRSRKSRTKGLVIVIVYLFASVFFMRLAAGIYMMAGAYADASDYAGLNLFEVFCDSIVHGLQSFSMDEDYTLYLLAVRQMCGEFFGTGMQWLGGLFVSLQNVLAPVAGGAVLVDILANLFPAVRLWMKTVAGRHVFFVFSELNEDAVCLAEDLLREDNAAKILRSNHQNGSPVLIFTDAYVDSEEEPRVELKNRVRELGGICTKTDLLFLNLQKANAVYYFLIDEDRMSNLSALAAIAERPLLRKRRDETNPDAETASAYIYVFTEGDRAGAYIRDLRKKHPDEFRDTVIREVNDYRSIAMNLLYDFPLYAPLAGREISEKRLTVTFLGSGQIAEEIFRNVFWFGQIADYRLEINVLSKNAGELKETLMRGYSEMMHTCVVDGQDADKNLLRIFPAVSGNDAVNPPYAYVRFVDCNVENSDFYANQKDILEQTHYFIVVLGDDRRNMGIAAELDQWLTRRYLGTERYFTPLIACAVFDERLGRIVNREPQDGTGCWVVPFGSHESRFSCKNIFLTDFTERSLASRNIYNKKHAKKDAEDEYKTLSSVARTAHASYKYFGEGRIAGVRLSGTHMSIRIRGEKTDSSWLQDPETEERLAWLEHRRWNAYIRAQGYAAPSSKEQLDRIYKNGKDAMNPKRVDIKIHPCLVESAPGIRPKSVSLNGMSYRECDLLDCLSIYLWSENRYEQGGKKPEELREDDYDYKIWDYPECDTALTEPGFAEN